MPNDTELLQDLKRIRDEIKLHLHLLAMDLKDEWEKLEVKFLKVESNLEESIEDFGKFNQQLWIGSDADVQSMLESYKKIHEHIK